MNMHRSVLNFLCRLLPATRGFAIKRVIARAAGIQIGDDAMLTGGFQVYGRSMISIGCSTWIGHNSRIYLGESGYVQIGRDCDIAPELVIHTGTHEQRCASRRAGAGLSLPVVIGDGSWVGTRVTILAGASIGRGSIVAAGSLIKSGQYPPNSLLAGVPAVVKKTLK